MSEVTIAQIERATEKFSAANLNLCDEVRKVTRKLEALNAAVARVKARHMEAIRAAAKMRRERKAALEALINSAPGLFVDPRSFHLHGVKIGLHSSKGNLQIVDKDKTVALIEEHFAELVKVLIKIEKTPIKTPIKALPAEDIEKIGCKIIGAGDHAIIEPTDGSGIEDIVAQLIDDPKKK